MLASHRQATGTGTALLAAGDPNRRLKGLTLKAGSDTATVLVYNAGSASGSPIMELTAVANTSASFFFGPDVWLGVNTGLFIIVSGTASSAILYYEGA